MHATEKNLRGLMGPAISKGSFKSMKLYTMAMVSSKIFCFVTSCTFVYNAVDVNKIATAFLLKPPP